MVFLYLTLIFLAVYESDAALVNPATVTCGPSEYAWCEYSNGLVRDGASPRKCAGQCLCEGHPSFQGDNLDWVDGKCVTPKGSACGTSTDRSMEIFCAIDSACISGRCRDPDAPKLAVRERCQDDVECQDGLKCRSHFVKSRPLPAPGQRWKRAIGPQYCCSARDMEFDDTTYTLETLPCN